MWGNHGASRTGEHEGLYGLVRRLSEDPLGTLWLGESVGSGEALTVRELRADLVADERFGRWLRLELRPISLLRHPNILEVSSSDVGPNGRVRFVIMGAFDGESLTQRLGWVGTLDRAEATAVAGQVANALAAAHEIGLVHGGVSADSVLLTSEGTVKVVDFGIPTALWLAARHPLRVATPTDSTPALIGPEPDKDRDARSLELLIQHMLSGVRPAEAKVGALVQAVLEDPPEETSSSLSAARTELPTRRFVTGAAIVALVATAAVGLVAVRSPSVSPRAQDRLVGSPSAGAIPSFSSVGSVRVPDVGGLTAMEAAALLVDSGLVVEDSEPAVGPPGEVVGTDPAIRRLVAPGTAVTLLVGALPERLDES